jgi:Flp pilus assembly protein TadD
VAAFELEDLGGEVEQARRETALAARLDEVLLDRVTASNEQGAGRVAAARAYRDAFREYGLDLEKADEAHLIRQVLSSPNRENLVAALNFVAWVEPRQRARLRAVARAAQPDSWKTLLGDIPPGLEMAEIQTYLKERLAGVSAEELTPSLLAHVGRLLSVTDEGLDLLMAAQRRSPSDFWINLTLGNTLNKRGRSEEAIGYLRVALAVRPHRGVVHHNLGIVLWRSGRLDAAYYSFREAARLDPNNPLFLYSYGVALLEKGLPAEAATTIETSLRLNPGLAKAHCDLGRAYRDTGRFSDALTAFRRGHELGSKDPAWRLPSARWVADCERLLELEALLPAWLTSSSTPHDTDEQLRLARVCRGQGLHVQAVGLYAGAFTDRERSGQSQSERTNAARSAIQASGADHLTDTDRAELRRQALGWLQDELADLDQQVKQHGKKARPALEHTLRRWQYVADLAVVRDAKALARLPEAESQAWRDFWKRVADRLAS